jgi:predicted ATP-grasp superfamily ATP-dependent carboligase
MFRSSRIAKPPAVVIGLDSITGLQTARVLAGHDVPVLGIAVNRHHPVCRTNACQALVYADTSSETLVSALHQVARIAGGPCVLFPCTDLSVLTLARCRDALADECHAVLPPADVVERLLDKASFHAYAVANGLPVANSRVLHTRSDAENAAAELQFPCVLKPAVKRHQWLSVTAAKIFRVNDAGELLRRYDMCRAWADPLIAQEFVRGGDDCHFTCNAYFDAKGQPVLTFVSQKLRQWPLEGGVGCLSRESRNDVVRDLTIQVFGRAGHHGLAYLEVKRDERTGRHVIIEPNVGRPTGRSAAADRAGVQLLWTQYCDALGLRLPDATPQRYEGAKWIYLRQDCQAAFAQWWRGQLTAADWVRSLRGCGADAMFAWTDLRPFFADIAHTVGKMVKGRDRPLRLAPPAPVDDRVPSPRRRNTSPAACTTEERVDYDVHGIVALRLIGASAHDVAALAPTLRFFQLPLLREPDIVVRFVDELPVEGLRWLEFGRSGFTDDGFVVLQSGKRPARMRMALEQIGGACELVCQRGLCSVPLLMSIIRLIALGRGYAPLHASAFTYNGSGMLLASWAKGGKTTGLVAFAAHGAQYIGDEWVLLGADGGMMYGLPEAMELHDWHLPALPALERQLSTPRRLLVKSTLWLSQSNRGARFSSTVHTTRLGATLARLRRRLDVRIDPLRVFSPGALAASPDRVFFMVRHDRPEIRVEPAESPQIAARIAAANYYEQLPLIATYLAYQSAYPGRRSELLDRARVLQAEMLTRALSGKEAFLVCHPSPCDLRALFAAMTSIGHEKALPLRHGAAPAKHRGDLHVESDHQMPYPAATGAR